MAGSWRHMTGRTGRFLNNENFCQMVENLGDAYETAEECFGMVWYLASELGDVTGTAPRTLVEAARVNYKKGLRAGGRQKGNE